MYDGETELYNLQSRYYDPEMGRFVNADDESILKLNQGHTSEYSLFVYCLNNPVNAKDDDGMYAVAIGAGVWLTSNPVGWVAAGLLLVAGVVIIAGMQYAKSKQGTGRPQLKKQGKERLEKRKLIRSGRKIKIKMSSNNLDRFIHQKSIVDTPKINRKNGGKNEKIEKEPLAF